MNYLIPAKGVVRPLFSCLCDKMLIRISEKPLSLATSIPDLNYLNREVMLLFQPLHIGA